MKNIAEAKGRVEGREEERMDILKGMLGNGMTLDAALNIINIPTNQWVEYRKKFNVL